MWQAIQYVSSGLTFAAFIAVAAHAARDPVAESVSANRSDLRIENARIAGPGADRLRTAVAESCYVYLGEDHGIAQVAQFADALTTELQPLGFHTFAL